MATTTLKARLGIERLDDRITPAVTNVTLAAGGALQVYGSDGSDAIIVRRQAGRVTIDGWAKTFTDAQVKQIEVYAKGGNDGVLILEDAKAAPIRVGIDGGAGHDFLVGSKGNDVLLGGAGDDYLLGLGGNDLLAGQDGNDILCGGAGNDAVLGGNGFDHFVGLRPGDGSDKTGGWLGETQWTNDLRPADALAWYQRHIASIGTPNYTAMYARAVELSIWENLAKG